MLRPALWLVTLLIPALAFTPQAARAGAWTLAEGDGQLIVTSGRKLAPAGALFGEIADRDTSTLYVFVEYGLTDRLTLGASGSAEWVATTNQMDLRVGAHARYRLWQGTAGDVFSVQAGASVPAEGWLGDPLGGPTADSVAEVDIGLLYGRGWISDWGNSFATGGAGFRWRGGGAADEIRLDLTAGHSFNKRLMGIFGAYSTVPLGGGDTTLKLAPSVAWTFWPWLGQNDKKPSELRHPRTIQLGLSYDVLNPADGLAVNLSVWSRF